MKKGPANTRITILRSAAEDDGLSTNSGAPSEIGRRWAKMTDASDGERARAAQQGQELTTRFLVTADSLTRTVNGKDMLSFVEPITRRDALYQVTGTKSVGLRHEDIEITATSRPDLVA